MSLESIIAINNEVAATAAEEGRQPHVPAGPEEMDSYPPFPFPALDGYVPAGWEVADGSWFVSRMEEARGAEPALDVEQFRKALREYVTDHRGHGFAITEEGPFQVVVSAMRRVHDRAAAVVSH